MWGLCRFFISIFNIKYCCILSSAVVHKPFDNTDFRVLSQFSFNFIIYDPQLLPYCLIWGTHISSHSPQVLYLGKRGIIILILFLHCIIHSQIFARLECMASVLSTQCPPIEASSIDQTQQSRFHQITREDRSLETLWLKNIRTMDKVQITDRSNVI
jgi:hypothetical protein